MSNTTRTSEFDALRNKIHQMSSKGFQKQDDDRYWKPDVDASGTGSAIIRFLSQKKGEEFPFVQLHTHGFKGPTGKWLIDNCPSTLGGVPSEVCPVCASNNDLWNASDDKEDPRKKLSKERKRKLSYISNILIVNDPKHPEKNGKVFLYRYGTKIFDKIKDMIEPPPEFADLQSANPFDPDEGANFKLRVVRVDKFPNYDKSSFDTPSPIGNADRTKQILEMRHSLKEVLDPKNFKSYADLKKRLDLVVPADDVTDGDQQPASLDEADLQTAEPQEARSVGARPARTRQAAALPTSAVDDAYFAKLVEQTVGEAEGE